MGLRRTARRTFLMNPLIEAGELATASGWTAWLAGLAKGGPVMLVLAALSVLATAIILLKVYQFAVLRIRARGFVDAAVERVRAGETDAALAALARERNPIARTMEAAVRGRRDWATRQREVREEVLRVGSREIAALESYLRGLEAVANLSPLLGLLGTVLGMIRAFQRLEEAGSRVDPALLSGGIWEALLTTAVGLAIAIPATAALNWLDSEVERVRRDMSDAVTRVFTSRLSPVQLADASDAVADGEPGDAALGAPRWSARADVA